MTTTAAVAVAEPATSRRRVWALGTLGWGAVVVLAVLALIAILGPLIDSTDPNQVTLSFAYVGPTSGHLLGFDGQGRDLLARLLDGSRPALAGPLLVVALSTVLGVAIALAAAWFGGLFDAIVARIIDAMFAFPGLLLAILAVSLFGYGLFSAGVALSIAYTPYVARIIRSAAMQECALPYVAALETQGFRASRIVLRHVLPNLSGLVVAAASLSFGYALIDLAALSFIGLGTQPPKPEWGVMVANGIPGVLAGQPQESLYAAVLIVITVGAANLLGDRLASLEELSR